MKRIHKLMLLSAAAALCLLLTGCYNEDPTSTGTSASGSYTEYKPPFEDNLKKKRKKFTVIFLWKKLKYQKLMKILTKPFRKI